MSKPEVTFEEFARSVIDALEAIWYELLGEIDKLLGTGQ